MWWTVLYSFNSEQFIGRIGQFLQHKNFWMQWKMAQFNNTHICFRWLTFKNISMLKLLHYEYFHPLKFTRFTASYYPIITLKLCWYLTGHGICFLATASHCTDQYTRCMILSYSMYLCPASLYLSLGQVISFEIWHFLNFLWQLVEGLLSSILPY